MATLRCGVVGLGRGKMFADILSRVEGCTVVAVCDPRPQAFQGISGPECFTDYGKFLDRKLDVVAVVSPGPAHAEQSVQALERGAHVLCETPCVYSLEEAVNVVRAVRSTGRRYMLAENYIWLGWCVTLQRMAEQGRFGEIVYAEGDYTHDCRDLMLFDEGGFVPYAERAAHPNARRTWRAISLPPIQYCSHTLGPLLRLMGDRVQSAFALSICGHTPDLAPTDLESALLRTRGGATIRLTNGFTVAHPYCLYYKLVGTRGSAMVLNAGQLSLKWWSETDVAGPGWQDAPPEMLQRPDGRRDVEVMIEEFVRSIREDREPPIGLHESLDMTLPGTVAHESGRQGGVLLEVPDSREF